MSRRPHPYSPDLHGSVRAARRAATADPTAAEQPGPGGDHRKPGGCWPLALLLLAGPAGILAGWLYGVVA